MHNLEGAENSFLNEEQLKGQIIDRITRETFNFDVNSDPNVVAILESCVTKAPEGTRELGEEEEFAVIGGDTLAENDTKCPYLAVTMIRPYKNENCKHHVSEDGVEAML